MPRQQIRAARRHYLWSAALAERAIREARKALQAAGAYPVTAAGVSVSAATSAASVIALHQATAASQAPVAVAQMLAEQAAEEAMEGFLNALSFVTPLDLVGDMFGQVQADWQVDRLVASLVQDSGRAAESVAIAATPRTSWVRYLNPPSCSRCAVLAGRRYRWSDGFDRHPGCDCVHIATTDEAAPELVSDPTDLLENGQITGLSRADVAALREGASWSQIINAKQGMTNVDLYGRRVRVTNAGITLRGGFGRSEFARRAGYIKPGKYRQTLRQRLTPFSIYKIADGDRAEAIRLLKLYGYIT